MQAFLIDPSQKTIEPVEYTGKLEHIYRLIEARLFAVSQFDADTGDAVYVDDEGLLTGEPERLAFFMVDGYSQPLAGKGLVLGVDAEGRSVAPTITLQALQERVSWYSGSQVVLMAEMGAFMELEADDE